MVERHDRVEEQEQRVGDLALAACRSGIASKRRTAS